MDLEARLLQIEDAIRHLNVTRLKQEGRTFAYEQAFHGLLAVAAPLPKVLESVHQALNVATTIALNSPEPEIKAQAVDIAAQQILKDMADAIDRASAAK